MCSLKCLFAHKENFTWFNYWVCSIWEDVVIISDIWKKGQKEEEEEENFGPKHYAFSLISCQLFSMTDKVLRIQTAVTMMQDYLFG